MDYELKRRKGGRPLIENETIKLSVSNDRIIDLVKARERQRAYLDRMRANNPEKYEDYKKRITIRRKARCAGLTTGAVELQSVNKRLSSLQTKKDTLNERLENKITELNNKIGDGIKDEVRDILLKKIDKLKERQNTTVSTLASKIDILESKKKAFDTPVESKKRGRKPLPDELKKNYNKNKDKTKGKRGRKPLPDNKLKKPRWVKKYNTRGRPPKDTE